MRCERDGWKEGRIEGGNSRHREEEEVDKVVDDDGDNKTEREREIERHHIKSVDFGPFARLVPSVTTPPPVFEVLMYASVLIRF